MLKIIPLPNIFETIKESYHMTPMGKFFLGSIAAQIAYDTIENQEMVSTKPLPKQTTPEDEVWDHYKKVLKMIDTCNGQSMNNFMNLSKDKKKSILISLFTQTKRADLISELHRYIFPTL